MQLLLSPLALALPALVAAQYGFQSDPTTTTTSAVSLPSNMHLVQLGVGNDVAFTPSSLSVQMGDTIIFQIASSAQVNHGIVQSDPTAPCTELEGGINSGLIAPNSNYAVTINTTDPLYFFCPEYQPIVHCETGMVFIVNPPSPSAITSFMSAASAVTNEATQTVPQSSGSNVVETSVPTEITNPPPSSGAIKGSTIATTAIFFTLVTGLFVVMA